MQVDEGFRRRMKEIQIEIMKKKGEFESFPKITEKVVKYPEWEIIEKKLMGDVKQLEFKINFDGRKLK